MEDVNISIMSGNLVRKPEVRITTNGKTLCKMRIASSRSHKGVSETCFMNIAVWGKQGENCATYLDKGSPLLVTGRIQMREFTDAEGKKTSTYEIVAEHVKWLSAPNKEHENIVSNADVPTSEDEDDTEF